MERFFAILQIFLAGLFLLMAASTLVNMVLIAFRPETISVVNALIGQTVLIVCFLALSRLLFKKGRARLTALTGDKDHAGHHGS
ncbi:MAG: hypothetical protein RLZZ385_2212 [Pseudomonadota bacterium]|jgi:hypothetical protein